MSLNRRKAILVACLVAISSPAFATDDGTWHGDDHGGTGSMSAMPYDWLQDLFSICVD